MSGEGMQQQSIGAGVEDPAGTALAFFIVVVAIIGWLALRRFVRSLRAARARAVVGEAFPAFAREALINAAKIDGRVNEAERVAVARALGEAAGTEPEPAALAKAFEDARLTKDELVAYLAASAARFRREEKVALIKGLLSVFAIDGRFDEAEHAALLDYTAAIGFDRQSAPEMLRGLARDLRRGAIV